MKVWKGIKDVALVWNDKCLRDEYHVLSECKKQKYCRLQREIFAKILCKWPPLLKLSLQTDKTKVAC